MTFFGRYMKRWAAVMLSLWLFGMASSIANNCLAAEPSHGKPTSESHEARSHGHGKEGHTHRGVDSKTPVGPHDHGATSGEPDAAQADANCRDFCGKVSVSVPAQNSLSVDVGPAGAPLPGYALQFAAPRREARVRAVRVDRDPAPPIRIRLVRLAL